MSVLIFIVSRPDFKRAPFWWMGFGIVLGLLVFTRMQLLYFVFAAMGSAVVSQWGRKRIFQFTLIAILGFLIGSSYQLISQYTLFGKWSLKPAYVDTYSGLYFAFLTDFRYNEISAQTNVYNKEFEQFAFDNQQIKYWEKPEYEKQMKQKFFFRLKNEWQKVVRNTAQNILWLWDKDHLSAYKDPWYPYDIWPLRIWNILLLSACFFGWYEFIKVHKWIIFFQPIFGISVLLFLYISLIIAMVSNETRHSLLFYPFAFLWAGNGIDKLFSDKRLE